MSDKRKIFASRGFLNRIVFVSLRRHRLLPKRLFTEIAKTGIDDRNVCRDAGKTVRGDGDGGTFGQYKIRAFNGHPVEEASVFELTEAELRPACERRGGLAIHVNPASWARSLNAPCERAALAAWRALHQ